MFLNFSKRPLLSEFFWWESAHVTWPPLATSWPLQSALCSMILQISPLLGVMLLLLQTTLIKRKAWRLLVVTNKVLKTNQVKKVKITSDYDKDLESLCCLRTWYLPNLMRSLLVAGPGLVPRRPQVLVVWGWESWARLGLVMVMRPGPCLTWCTYSDTIHPRHHFPHWPPGSEPERAKWIWQDFLQSFQTPAQGI